MKRLVDLHLHRPPCHAVVGFLSVSLLSRRAVYSTRRCRSRVPQLSVRGVWKLHANSSVEKELLIDESVSVVRLLESRSRSDSLRVCYAYAAVSSPLASAAILVRSISIHRQLFVYFYLSISLYLCICLALSMYIYLALSTICLSRSVY